MTEFEEIYRRYFQDVYRYIMRLSQDEHVAEEITSETFFKAMDGLKRFRGDCEVRVWLCQIAKNSYYSYQKKNSRTRGMDDAAWAKLSTQEESLEERWERKDQAMRIRSVLHQVPEPYKEVFLWRVFAELTFKEIGQIFGKSENWACVTYHRAKAMIQNRLEDTTS
ncbi:sigma-70 family RNA polymerase sigma factor [Pseudoflavonifractor sp. An85]|uniref:RNA polymerase sigma factor n=1 Tax=Pseudoflavonifractor sp. An85 TaxID=1965661 RepID=UPI000B3753C6|nr:sigma-70 family RNA polymerase sigma factor [Pseudoflavonifractor sp. An85]OUN26019.1 RNA polymerase subunit sigma [Pseudoflavonifractor sp. An85]